MLLKSQLRVFDVSIGGKIICIYKPIEAIISDNGTHIANNMGTNFYRDLGIQIKFVYVVHPQADGQAELANKLILKGLKNKLDDPRVYRKKFSIKYYGNTTPIHIPPPRKLYSLWSTKRIPFSCGD